LVMGAHTPVGPRHEPKELTAGPDLHSQHTDVALTPCECCCCCCPAVLPAALSIYFLGILLPFYSSINSLMGAISAPTTAFLLPAVTFNVVFRSKGARAAAASPPPKALQVRWSCCHQHTPAHVLVQPLGDPAG